VAAVKGNGGQAVPRVGDAGGEVVAGGPEGGDDGVDEVAVGSVGQEAGAIGPGALGSDLGGEGWVTHADPDCAAGAGTDAGDTDILWRGGATGLG
jgi:hypothetical protein